MPVLNIAAPAKLNLALSVKFPPEDGFHQLDSVFQQIDLCDELTFNSPAAKAIEMTPGSLQTKRGTWVYVECTRINVEPANNLVYKAIEQFEEVFDETLPREEGEGIAVRIVKQIPSGAGMGGGSSDAAATIKYCAWLKGVNPLDERCQEVARRVGSDVPFFLHGGAALMGGRGDELIRTLRPLPLAIVLMGSNTNLSTAKVYEDFDANPQPELDVLALADALDQLTASASIDELKSVAHLFGNNLEEAVVAAQPEIAERLAFAKDQDDVLAALVTGSGSTAYALCPSQGAANRFAVRVASLCDWTAVSMPR